MTGTEIDYTFQNQAITRAAVVAALGPSNVIAYAPTNPSAFSSLTEVMAGFACSFTPKYTGKIKIWVVAEMSSNIANDGAGFRGRYGTGAAPNNGDAATGTQISRQIQPLSGTINQTMPFSLLGLVTGLALGTAIWFDLGVQVFTGGTPGLNQTTIIIEELMT